MLCSVSWYGPPYKDQHTRHASARPARALGPPPLQGPTHQRRASARSVRAQGPPERGNAGGGHPAKCHAAARHVSQDWMSQPSATVDELHLQATLKQAGGHSETSWRAGCEHHPGITPLIQLLLDDCTAPSSSR